MNYRLGSCANIKKVQVHSHNPLVSGKLNRIKEVDLVSRSTCRCLTMFNNVGLRYIKLSRCAPQKQDCDLQGMQPLLMLFITSLFDTVRSTGNES